MAEPVIDLRDDLTRSRLELAVAHLTDVDVVEFEQDWWDGQAHAPCLVVRGGRRHRLLRVVEAGGEALVVPFDRRTAQRWLAELRRPRRPELGIPSQRTPGEDAVFDADADVLRCASPTCGALLPIDHDGACPVCGGGAAVGESEEKSTVTGARTAGSSTSK
ncbi:MAG: hypothetical protein QOD07_2818 [Frankiaceae bacterium]|jgi:hypothetical protein|nr:hypothetical protein [Frankiaceae bacterium]